MNTIFIDVREPYEYSSGHVKDAVNIPPADLMTGTAKLNNIPKDAEIVVYCKTGSRSNVSMNILHSLGYTNITNGINKDHVASDYGVETT